jgi:hypothetical protein
LVSLHLRNLLHRKLLSRLAIPSIIAAAMLVGVIIDDTFFMPIPAITFPWTAVGLIIGYTFGRMIKISWNSDKTQLVLDGSSMVVIVVYLVIRIVTSITIRMEFSYLSYLLAIVLLVSVGSLTGKTLGTMNQIKHALMSNNSSSSRRD